MKVLHLPNNAASQLSIMVRAQRQIGLDARGLVFGRSVYQDASEIRTLDSVPSNRTPAWWVGSAAPHLFTVVSEIVWADVIHWHTGGPVLPFDLALKLTSQLNKARFVQFWGSDIRIPERSTVDNPYLADLLGSPNIEYQISYSRSRQRQKRFMGHGYECLVPGPELEDYVQRDIFPIVHKSNAAITLEEFEACYPDPNNSRPLVVHMPSKPTLKGTESVLATVESLLEDYDFEFKLIHGLPRVEALKLLRGCDIMLDQFVIGSYGLAALEAMALGKPVICYVRPSLLSKLPAEFPIINADQQSLSTRLARLLQDGRMRHDLGIRGRQYVERHHDSIAIAKRLKSFYQSFGK